MGEINEIYECVTYGRRYFEFFCTWENKDSERDEYDFFKKPATNFTRRTSTPFGSCTQRKQNSHYFAAVAYIA